jgi:hypothetical protein
MVTFGVFDVVVTLYVVAMVICGIHGMLGEILGFHGWQHARMLALTSASLQEFIRWPLIVVVMLNVVFVMLTRGAASHKWRMWIVLLLFLNGAILAFFWYRVIFRHWYTRGASGRSVNCQ